MCKDFAATNSQQSTSVQSHTLPQAYMKPEAGLFAGHCPFEAFVGRGAWGSMFGEGRYACMHVCTYVCNPLM